MTALSPCVGERLPLERLPCGCLAHSWRNHLRLALAQPRSPPSRLLVASWHPGGALPREATPGLALRAPQTWRSSATCITRPALASKDPQSVLEYRRGACFLKTRSGGCVLLRAKTWRILEVKTTHRSMWKTCKPTWPTVWPAGRKLSPFCWASRMACFTEDSPGHTW